VVERVWRDTWRQRLCELEGRNRASLDSYSEAVDGRRAGCWASILQLVNLQRWECAKVTVPLSAHGELADGSRSCREAHRELKLHSGVTVSSWEWREDKQAAVDAVFGVCCAGCIIVLGVCCTWCQLMIMTWGDREGWLNFVFCNDGRVVNKRERDVGWRWEWCGGYKRLWEIRGASYLIRLGRPRIGVIARRIGSPTGCIGDRKFTCTWNSLKSQFLMMISPIFSHPSLSRPRFYHHLRTQS